MRTTLRAITSLTAVTALAVTLAPAATASTGPESFDDPVAVREEDPGDKAFGSAVDVDGDTMVVAAVCDPTAGGNCDGSAYAFVRSGDAWVQQAKFIPPNPQKFAEFGQSVAVSGNTIVIGSNDNLPGVGNTGKAYVYVRTGTTWSLQAQLLHRDPQRLDQFGRAVAIDGDTIVVGARFDDVGDFRNSGSASVFTRSGTTWTEQALLRASDRESDDRFGTSVAVQGGVVLVGATSADTDVAENAGAVYAYALKGDTWKFRAKLFAPDGAESDNLGASVALDGTTAVAGSGYPGEPYAVQVFVRSGRSWSRQATLLPGGDLTPSYGAAVDISGDTVVVGDQYDNQEEASGGAAYVYTRTGDSWDSGLRLKPEVQNPYDQFGVDVAADGGLVAVGAFIDPDEAVLVYER